MMDTLCLMKFGSHLYGTNTEKSDTDYKGIFMPTIDDCILQRVPHSLNNITKKDSTKKNTNTDIDKEIYSIHYFIELALKGETVALDMLHAPDGWEEVNSVAWQFIKNNRKRFYTKNLRAYIGYVKVQAAKYGIKGSRLADAERILNQLKVLPQELRLCNFWEDFKESEHVKKIIIEDADCADKRALEVCGRKLMSTIRIGYAVESVQKFYDNYGERAKMAKENLGVDFKAVSHAFRAGLQLKEIYETGSLVYPLKQADFLKEIKSGKYHYADELAPQLEQMVINIDKLAQDSLYPEKADRKYWDNYILGLYK